MEIFYFNTQGEKIGPITKEVLINLAEAGTVTQETVFEINGKKVRGKHIKNLRPIFEKVEAAGQDPPNTTDSADSAGAADSFPELPSGDEFAFPPMGAEEIAQHSEDVKSGAYTPNADKIFETAFIRYQSRTNILKETGTPAGSEYSFFYPSFTKKEKIPC